jgi:predicted MFS family arabinose efflux permease
VVACSTFGMCVCVAYQNTLGPSMIPFLKEFGWSRGDVSFALFIVDIIAVLLCPLVGLAVDRFGARRVAIPGIFIYSCGVALLSQAGPSVHSWWLLSIIVGFGFPMMTSAVWLPGVASNFTKSRGLAIGLSTMGNGVAALIVPYLMTSLTQDYGWRTAYVIIGGLCLLVVIPTIFWFRDARDLRPQDNQTRSQKREGTAGLTPAQIFRSRRYWQLAAVAVLATAGLIGLAIHLVPILRDTGIAPRKAAAIAGLIGLGNFLGRAFGGYCLDRIHGSIVGCIAFGISILACVLLLMAPGSAHLASCAAFLLGMALGSETDVIAYLAGRYFGLRHYGLAYGTLAGGTTLGAGIGPWIAGTIFDHQGNYTLFETMLCGSFGVAILLVSTLGRYPDSLDAIEYVGRQGQDLTARPERS